MSETNGARDAIKRIAGRMVESSAKTGRKLSHDQAMDRARVVARRHDRRTKD